MSGPPHYRIEVGSHANRKWRWVASALQRGDAEQLMFREWLDRPRRVVASDGTWTSHVPFGKLDPGEL